MENRLNKYEVYDWIIVLIISGGLMLIGNVLGYGETILSSMPGMLWLVLFTFLGFIIQKIIPFDLPAVAYISIIAILFSMPLSPISEIVVSQVERINLLATTTPILAYAGVTVGKDWPLFKQIGYRGVIVSLLVIIGTVLMCVLFAEVFFRIF